MKARVGNHVDYLEKLILQKSKLIRKKDRNVFIIQAELKGRLGRRLQNYCSLCTQRSFIL